jgi:hypothetical protein
MDENSPISKQFATQETIKSFYLEGKLMNDEKTSIRGIGIKTETTVVMYDWKEGVILSPKGIIRCEDQCQTDDVIGCRMTLDVNKKGNQPLHNVVFYRNGLAVSNAIILEGNIPISVVFLCDSQCEATSIDKIVDLNFGDRPFIHNIGNYNCFCRIFLKQGRSMAILYPPYVFYNVSNSLYYKKTLMVFGSISNEYVN